MGGWSFVEMLCLKLLPKCSSHLNETLLHNKLMHDPVMCR